MSTPARASGQRWSLIAELVGDAESVLDVGCRDRGLEVHLSRSTRYIGLDLGPPADVIADVSCGIPFDDGSFEVVVYADVLEHLDDPHAALDEGMRVATRAVVVLLPNTSSFIHRIQFATGRFSDKYGLRPDNELDRHRWLVSFDEADEFVSVRAKRSGWRVARSLAYDGGPERLTRKLAVGVARRVGGPSLWAWEYAARLEAAS